MRGNKLKIFEVKGQTSNLEVPTRYRFDTDGASQDDLDEIECCEVNVI